MKKSTLLIFLFGLFFFNSFLKNEMYGQSVSVTIQYGGYITQCCSANTTNYFCFNTPNNTNYCGQTTTCNTQAFFDPVPAGNIVTSILVNYYSAGCAGGTMSGSINGTVIGSVAEANTGCLCTNTVWATTGNNTGNYPCGIQNAGITYNYGANNNFTFCASVGQVCIDRCMLTITYAPANQANPASQPGAISGPTPVCAGVAYNYSIPAVGNATGYTWTVPAGWTINSGQGTTNINATPGGAGNICVSAYNQCGTSAQTCFPVTIASPSSAPASASANPTTICPSASSTLTVNGGALGSGAVWTWHTGSCAGPVVGTGISIVVSPGSTTTYYVGAVGTCNSTGCASVVVTVGGTTPVPGAPTGNLSVCSGSSNVYTTTGSAGATSYNWTVPGGAVINSGQGTTSISVTFGGSSGNICVDATGPCGTSAPSCTPITITTVPLAPTSITGTTPVCPGNQNYTIGAVAGSTGYTWSTAGAGGSITAGQGTTGITVSWSSSGVGTVSVTADNSCGSSVATTFTVLVNPLPIVTAVATPTAVCPGNSVTLTGGGANIYSWLGGVTNGVPFVPSNTQVYTVTGTDANGCVNTANITVAVDPTPTVSISGTPSQTVCSGGSITGITFSSNPPGTISWTNTNTGLGGPDLSSSTGSGSIGAYTAPIVLSQTTGVVTGNSIASGSGCPSTGTSASFTITINPLPIVTASVVTAAPCGQNTGCITSVTASGGVPTYSYSYDGGTTWSTSSTNCNIAAGAYPVQIIDQNGCVGNSSITIPSSNGPSAPTVSASATTACVGDNISLSINSPQVGYTYTWTDITGTYTGTTYTITNISPAGNYTISVTATDPNSCVSTTSTIITIIVNAAPTPPILSGTATNPLIQCQGVTPGTITVATTGTITSVPVWYNGTTWVTTGLSYLPSTSIPGTTVYTIVDSATVSGCINNSAGNVLTVTVTILPGPSAPVLAGSTTNPMVECQGQTPLVATVATTGTVTSVPVWYNGSTWVTTGTTYTPSTAVPGTTVYTIIDSATVTGCTSLSIGNVLTLTVTINPNPTPPVIAGSTTNPFVQCQGGTPGVITVAQTGTVTSIPVWYNGTTWVNTGTSYTPVTSTPGTTVYTIIDSATVTGCMDASAGNVLTVTVTVNPNPTAGGTIVLDSAMCGLSTGSITGVTVSGGTPGYTYQWYNGSTPIPGATQDSLSNVGPGTYSVLITDANGCPATGGVTSFTVPSGAAVNANFTPNVTTGFTPLSVTFSNTSTGATSYAWSFGNNTATSTLQFPSYTYTTPGTYTVVLIASNGTCADTITSIIITDVATTIVIPNIFSPNGDGINDEFIIMCTGIKTLSCDIFNRWGIKLFTIAGPNQAWDGRIGGGNIASEGTYFFILKAEGFDTKTYVKEGPLTLVK